MSTELFPRNGCCTVACLHCCYLAVGLHVTIRCIAVTHKSSDENNFGLSFTYLSNYTISNTIMASAHTPEVGLTLSSFNVGFEVLYGDRLLKLCTV
jgi:hypothetical protein